MTGPECTHGIALAKFCYELHLPDVGRVETVSETACPHGVELDKFCHELHNRTPRLD